MKAKDLVQQRLTEIERKIEWFSFDINTEIDINISTSKKYERDTKEQKEVNMIAWNKFGNLKKKSIY